MSNITKNRVVAVLGIFFVIILITNKEKIMATDNNLLRENFFLDEKRSDDSPFSTTFR
jgi:hypothetical protein